jgi:hypothetical protein
MVDDANSSAEAGPEPTLTLKLSDGNEFYCSACPNRIASIGVVALSLVLFENWLRCSATTSSATMHAGKT